METVVDIILLVDVYIAVLKRFHRTNVYYYICRKEAASFLFACAPSHGKLSHI